MASLEYSPAALDTLPQFHRVRFVIFVEGPEDLRFWTVVLSELSLTSHKIKVAGGKETLFHYAHAIIEDNAAIVVALDLDLSNYDGTRFTHTRVLYTYGYSIENSLCFVSNLSTAIANLACIDSDLTTDVQTWLDEFSRAIEPLVILDIVNRAAKGGHRIPLQNAARFQDDNKRHKISARKVQSEVQRLMTHIDAAEHTKVQILLASSGKPMIWCVRGHFLFSAVLNYVRYKVWEVSRKRMNLSYDTLFAILIGQFRLAVCDEHDRNHLRAQVSQMAAA